MSPSKWLHFLISLIDILLGNDEKKNKLCTTKHHNNKHKKHHNKAPNCPSVLADILNVLYSNKTEENTNKVYYETGTSLSFSQFVSFLILGSRSDQMMVSLSRQIEFNIHWSELLHLLFLFFLCILKCVQKQNSNFVQFFLVPYWTLCSPCHIHAMPTGKIHLVIL